jgi:HPt (histidine-containing phosphotransfer) domain-containing protein
MTHRTSVSLGPDAACAPAIDRSVLGEWVAGEESAIDAMLVIFRDNAVAELTTMRAMLAQGGTQGGAGAGLTEFSRAAHRLRGAALSMGARSLARVAGELEAASHAGKGTWCERGMFELEIQMTLMQAEVPAGAETSNGGPGEHRRT